MGLQQHAFRPVRPTFRLARKYQQTHRFCHTSWIVAVTVHYTIPTAAVQTM